MTYALLDFGSGRKLESLSGYRIDRPSPSADTHARAKSSAWKKVDARFDLASKRWTFFRPWPDQLSMDCDGFCMPVRPTPFGHIGLFPEQFDNWQWLRHSDLPDSPISESPLQGLNLFGYTGASTMAMVSAGFAVAHVDAAKPNVDATRQAAAANGWADRPIRYLVDDAVKFAAREVRRKRHYHTIVLDPPAYGHGPSGKAWRLERDLWPLLDDCLKLLGPTDNKSDLRDLQRPTTAPRRLLITGHTESVGAQDVIRHLRASLDSIEGNPRGLRIESSRSQLKDASNRSLDCGFQVRVTFSEGSEST